MPYRTLSALFRLGLALILLGAYGAHAGTLTFPLDPTGPAFNPERGVYAQATMDASTNFNSLRSQGYALALGIIELEAWRTVPISVAGLNDITTAFNRLRTAGMKAIIRIRYSSDQNGLDATLAQMEAHLQQLQPILNANIDVIVYFQAGMIGAWGEWHTSSNGLDTPAGRQAVWDLLTTYLPATKAIQVRTPGYVNELENLSGLPLASAEAFNGTPRARIAHHNDCFISSDIDWGTYPTTGPIQDALKTQIGNDTRYVPWTGETCSQDADNANCTRGLNELAQFHATSLSGQYHPQVINDLTTEGCWTTIRLKLGHRIQITSATLPDSFVAGQPFTYALKLRNAGWAPFYNPRPVILRLLTPAGGVIQDYALSGANTDPRFWLPENGDFLLTGTLTAPSSFSVTQAGLALWLPDNAVALRSDPDFSVRLANTGLWSASAGHNLLVNNLPVLPPPGEIAIDGNFSDWDRFSAVTTDPTGDQGTGLADFTALWVANDDSYYYFRLQTSSALDFFSSARNNIFIDTDNNAATGFGAVAGRIGSEVMLQAGTAYQQKNGGFNEGVLGSLGFIRAPAGSTNDVEFRLSRNATFLDATPIFAGSTLRVLVESESGAFVTQDTLPNAGTTTYALNTNYVPVELSAMSVE